MNANTGWPKKGAAGAKKDILIFAPLALFCGHLLLLSGCSKPASSSAPTAVAETKSASTPTAKPEAPKEDRHPLTGEILRVDSARGVLIVQHDEIKGFMPAMTMEFTAAAGDIALAKPGQRIRAEMVNVKDSDLYRLEKIWPADKVAADTVAAGALQLRQETHTLGKNAYREIGEAVPNFALYDQSGRVVQSARFRGKQIMINFIFTRCPIATMCPAATIKMMNLQRLAREAAVPNLELISITLDPTFDTPGVLKEYADVRGIDTANFSFLTGPETAIKDLLTQFGVIAEFDGAMIKHTLTTLLINADGKIAHRADGSAWEPADFVAKMKK